MLRFNLPGRYLTSTYDTWPQTGNIVTHQPLASSNGWTVTTYTSNSATSNNGITISWSGGTLYINSTPYLYPLNTTGVVLWDNSVNKFFVFDQSNIIVLNNSGLYEEDYGTPFTTNTTTVWRMGTTTATVNNTSIASSICYKSSAYVFGCYPAAALSTSLGHKSFSFTRALGKSYKSTAIPLINRMKLANRTFGVSCSSIAARANKVLYTNIWSFVHTGVKWIGSSFFNEVVHSNNGKNWTKNPGLIRNDVNGRFTCIAWNGTIAATLAIGQATVTTTTDGVTLNTTALPNARDWSAICAGGTTFVGLARWSNKCVSSPDGVTWTEYSLPVLQNWSSVAWNGTIFVAVGDSNIAATSPDGVTWTQRTMPDNINYTCVHWALGQFTAVAAGPTNLAAKSTNGIGWSRITMPESRNWNGLGTSLGEVNG